MSMVSNLPPFHGSFSANRTPLQITLLPAARKGSDVILRALLHSGADPNGINPLTSRLPLHTALRMREYKNLNAALVIRALLDASSIDVNNREPVADGQTPLAVAESIGDGKFYRELLAMGANSSIEDGSGKLPAPPSLSAQFLFWIKSNSMILEER